ncbi:hypothetical protein L6164_012135 [Bauhinia variegata]|uniref:Uncharacterized protein n=1 Tax=Bauhinia variegata TaxID=167791 RepID=A0ACB9P8J3_BAUVA|nr:hypothetical protein L6164_012135 [Bauhinia variegata]
MAPMDLHALQSRIEELREIHKCCAFPELNPSEAEKLLKDCALEVENRVQQIVSDCSDVGYLDVEDLDVYLEHLKDELNKVEVDSADIINEIEVLTTTHKEDSIMLEAKLEELEYSLDFTTSKHQKTLKANEGADCLTLEEDHSTLTSALENKNLEILELDHLIDEKKSILKSLQDLQSMVQWIDALEQIEDALTGIKVLAFDGNSIRLSLQTYIPKLEGISYVENIDNVIDAAEVNHELSIEVLEGTLKLKNVQVFPNDVYVNDIVNTAKSLSKSSLQCFVRKVQDRIILSTLRRLVVKDANKSRYSLEYLYRDETIVAHMAGGIDAFIKLSQGWPLFGSPLKLISLKNSDNEKGISLSFLCKVEKLANSSDTHIRQNLSRFTDAIEEILKEQMQLDLHAGDT